VLIADPEVMPAATSNRRRDAAGSRWPAWRRTAATIVPGRIQSPRPARASRRIVRGGVDESPAALELEPPPQSALLADVAVPVGPALVVNASQIAG
jgi:hypothetical protein